VYSWSLKHAVLGLVATTTVAGCRPDRLPGEETLAEQAVLVNETTTSESTALAGDQVLGRIGKHDLMFGDFDRRVSMLSQVGRTMFDTDQRRATLLELIIRAEVMALEAQRLGLVEGRFEQQYVDEALLRRWLIEDVLLGRIASESVTEADVAEHFARNEHVYSAPEQRRALMLLVATEAEALAHIAEIQADTAVGPEPINDVFSRYVSRFSLHTPTREAAGDTGRTASIEGGATGNAAVLAALFATEPNSMTAPIETADGWVVLLVSSVTPSNLRTAEQYDWYVRDLVFRQQNGDIARAALEALRSRVPVSVDSEVVAMLAAARSDGGPETATLPRRFDAAGLGEHPSRYVGQAAWDALHGAPEWRNNPNFGFAPAEASEASGAAAPEVQE
jgi:parvulin-like peptidyl-prolyl isomerase